MVRETQVFLVELNMLPHVMLVFSSIIASSFATVELPTCPQLPAVQNFNATKAANRWYEVARYPFIFEVLLKCVTADYSVTPGNRTFGISYRGINNINGEVRKVEASGYMAATDARFNVTTNGIFANKQFPYQIVAMEYDKYALLYGCVNEGLAVVQYAWKLTREPQPSKEILDTMDRMAAKVGLSSFKFRVTPQTDCDYGN